MRTLFIAATLLFAAASAHAQLSPLVKEMTDSYHALQDRQAKTQSFIDAGDQKGLCDNANAGYDGANALLGRFPELRGHTELNQDNITGFENNVKKLRDDANEVIENYCTATVDANGNLHAPSIPKFKDQAEADAAQAQFDAYGKSASDEYDAAQADIARGNSALKDNNDPSQACDYVRSARQHYLNAFDAADAAKDLLVKYNDDPAKAQGMIDMLTTALAQLNPNVQACEDAGY